MKTLKTLCANYFCGNEISEYGQQNGFLDYGTLSKAFNHVLNNEIYSKMIELGYYWELYNGNDYDEENDTYTDIFQYYIISEQGAEIISEYTNDIIYYNEALDMYLWGVDHWGTSWDYVLTDVKCNCGYDDI